VAARERKKTLQFLHQDDGPLGFIYAYVHTQLGRDVPSINKPCNPSFEWDELI